MKKAALLAAATFLVAASPALSAGQGGVPVRAVPSVTPTPHLARAGAAQPAAGPGHDGAMSKPIAGSTSIGAASDIYASILPFRFAGIWAVDPTTGQPASSAPGAVIWKFPWAHDLQPPSLVHLSWEPTGFPQADLPKLIAGVSYGFELHLNGKTLHQGPDGSSGDFYATPVGGAAFACAPGKACLGTSIKKTIWFATGDPWSLELVFWKKVVPHEPVKKVSMHAVVHRQQPVQSYFATHIYPTFQHARCTNCHAFGSVSGLESAHESKMPMQDGGINGHIGPYMISTAAAHTGSGTVITCGGGCHYDVGNSVPGTQFNEVEWKAPAADLGIDWRGKSAKQVCDIVTSRLPTSQALRNHLQEDARIGWAVQSGKTPAPLVDKKPVAPPGSYSAWVAVTNKWIGGGSPCPK